MFNVASHEKLNLIMTRAVNEMTSLENKMNKIRQLKKKQRRLFTHISR